MNCKIICGTLEHLSDCKEALVNSELGLTYYSSDEILESFLSEGLTKGEIFVAQDQSGEVLGYIWISLKGAFYKFPYCRSLAVKTEYRGMGVGKALLKYYVQIGFQNSSKLFILVSDFNKQAKKLYESMGFSQVGLVPDLFKDGVAEFILVKSKLEDDIA